MADRFLTLTEIAKKARLNLDRNAWDYLVGGSETESALKRNRYGVDRWVFKPRILNDVSSVTVTTEQLGVPMRMPVFLPPIGSIQVFEAAGAEAVARAAAEFGTLQILSSVCQPDFETLAERVPGPRVFQLYLQGDEAWMDDHIARAIEAGYTAFCLTADTQVYSRRERDILKRHVPASGSQVSRTTDNFDFQAKMSWQTVAHIKEKFDLPLVIKGVNAVEDAERCLDAGVDVIYVSNHGGRQLDHTRACIDALPEVVAAVAGRAPVWVDGGFMRGADVAKALCLGADAVGMGRLEALAMAAGGESAVLTALEIVEHELMTALALMGVASLDELGPHLVEQAPPIEPTHVLSAFPLLEEY